MDSKYKYSVVIARAQPFHLAHQKIVKIALQQSDNVIVILGSYKRSPSPRNPWSGEEREAMVRVSFSPEENTRITVIHMRDYLYNDNMWVASLTQQVAEVIDDSDSVVLVGHEHDHSSYYLKLFPQWDKYLIPNMDEFPHATEIRYLYFTYDSSYKKFVPTEVIKFLEGFSKTEKFKSIKAYFDVVREGKNAWAGAPYPPIFHTTDCVVLKSGHILCVRRGKAYGGGQLALPGGFLEQNETLKTGAIRELKEETAIALSKEELTKSIKSKEIFDSVERSDRGRTLTSAFFLDLGSGTLPKVKGSSDADKAFWLPLNEIYTREEEWFEDHLHIVNFFVGSPMMRG